MPLIGTLGLFILIGNLLNIIPGLGAPTGFIETNLAWAIVCVLTVGDRVDPRPRARGLGASTWRRGRGGWRR